MALSFVLMVQDAHHSYLNGLRASLYLIVSPLQYAVHYPIELYSTLSGMVVRRTHLLEENAALRTQHLLLNAQVQQLSALKQENARLKVLLKSSATAGDSVLVAKLLQVDPDPFSHRVILDKGSQQGVYIGQPVLDAFGVMGQIDKVGLYTSVVLLLTDISHAVPIQNNRSGTRTIAIGTGKLDELELNHVTNTADLRQGDLLVTSGLGRRFPIGYPVGRIQSIQRDPGEAFIRVVVRPAAHLDRSREVLLVWPELASEKWAHLKANTSLSQRRLS